MLFLIVLLALYFAWNLGANDVANSMGTSVGSKAITLKQAIIIAGILEFVGAVFFGENVAATLATNLTNNNQFSAQPNVLLFGMISVLISCGIWLQIATSFGLPVASSHGVVGAIAGFSAVAIGAEAINWANIGLISLGWLLTPVLSGILAAIFYRLLQIIILNQADPESSLNQWILGLNILVFSVFGVIVFPSILDRPLFHNLPVPTYIWAFIGGGIASICLTTAFKNALFALQNEKNDKNDLSKRNLRIEAILGKFQVISACFVAFAHGSNDVGNAVAPLAAIAYIMKNNAVPLQEIPIPLWVLVVGGIGIVGGLAVQGKNVIATVGESIIELQPSSGFSAELATATTILIASRLGLPVSTSHALVGAVVGIGLFKSRKNVNFATLKSVFAAWIITIPATAGLAALIFFISQKLWF
jgi:inorganic phosphate transporter, PiT family